MPSCITLRARAVPDIRVAIIEDQAEMRDGLADLIKLWQEKWGLALDPVGAESNVLRPEEGRKSVAAP